MLRHAGNTGAVGLEIAVAITLCFFGGKYLDGKLDTSPWLMWIGFAAGIGASIKTLVRVVREYKRQTEKNP